MGAEPFKSNTNKGKKMIKLSTTLMTLSMVSGLGFTMPACAQVEHDSANAKMAIMQPRPKTIEMVFVLDTTSSMGGLLEGAKTKIWRIVNDVMQNQKLSGDVQVKVGLVAYRDKGDSYVTQVTPLSADLDQVYSQLIAYQAVGGGDTPEDVRSALQDGLNQVGWTQEGTHQGGLSQILFLVGDAPPHDDYRNSMSAQDTARTAYRRGIRVNAIQAGNDASTARVWREIAQYGGGEYFAIAQNGGVKVVATPYDDELAKLGDEVGRGAVYFGRSAVRAAAAADASLSFSSIAAAPIVAKADRAINKSINSKAYNKQDVIQAIENKEISLAAIKPEELPSEMQKMSLEERDAFVQQKIAQRKETNAKITELAKKRDTYLAEKEKGSDGFDATVSKTLKKQIK